MCSNTVTEIIKTLGSFEIHDDKLAWNLKQLMDKLWLIEGIYEELSCSHLGLNEQERDRYVQEVFPSILFQCRKLSHYFTICPELRRNEQGVNMLRTYFKSYGKIMDRLLTKLQKSQRPFRFYILDKMRKWLGEFKENIVSVSTSIARGIKRFACRFSVALPRPFVGRKTAVVYHRDTVDYVCRGYNLQPIPVLALDGF